MQTLGRASLTWPLIFRPLHDALVEDALAKAARNLELETEAPKWRLRVQVLRSLMRAVLRPDRQEVGAQT